MSKIVADLDVSSTKKVVEVKRGEIVDIGADLSASLDTHISRQNEDNYGLIMDAWVRMNSKPRAVESPVVSSNFEKFKNVKSSHNLRLEMQEMLYSNNFVSQERLDSSPISDSQPSQAKIPGSSWYI
jgi:hypothetical protein